MLDIIDNRVREGLLPCSGIRIIGVLEKNEWGRCLVGMMLLCWASRSQLNRCGDATTGMRSSEGIAAIALGMCQ